MRMAVYIVRRVALVVPVIVGVMTIVFALTSALPPADRILTYHSPSPHSSCADTSATCKCYALGEGNNTTQCRNPLYWSYYHQLGLDNPIPIQWATYMYHSFTFQWGNVANNSNLTTIGPYSNFKNLPVTELLGAMLPYTLELAAMSLLIILAISIPLGNLAAVNRNRPIDQASRVLSFSGFALPPFLLGTATVMGVVILVTAFHGPGPIATPWCTTKIDTIYNEFTGSWPLAGCYTSGKLDPATQLPAWLINGIQSTPSGFPTIDAAYHGQYWLALDSVIRLILPALVIAYGSIAGLLRFVRNSMLEVMNLDYIRTARAKGVPEKAVIKKHAGRNSMNVTITVLGLTFAFFIGGFPVIEEVFSLDGIGRGLALSVQGNFDFGVVFGSTLLFTYLVVAANILVDVLYAYLDPRVRLG